MSVYAFVEQFVYWPLEFSMGKTTKKKNRSFVRR